TTRAQTTPASAPSTSVQPGLSTLQEGAAATSPTTSPEAAPTEVTFPVRTFSTASQPRIAAAGATSVFIAARTITPSTAAADPALNPNQRSEERRVGKEWRARM